MSTGELVSLLEKSAVETVLDWSLKIEAPHGCGWSIEVRITPKTNAEGPDVSTVLFLGGLGSPEECAAGIPPDVERLLAGPRGEAE